MEYAVLVKHLFDVLEDFCCGQLLYGLLVFEGGAFDAVNQGYFHHFVADFFELSMADAGGDGHGDHSSC